MSNLLEKASIVTTPTAYENGKILSVKPTPGLGNEKIVNGDFATDSDWSKGTGWAISNGKATHTGSTGNFTQNIGVSGKKVLLTFEVLTIDNGVCNVIDADISTIALASFSTIGVKTVTLNFVGNLIGLRSNSTNCSIDNVSVKELIDGDFDFTRNSSATRVNSEGLIEDVQILSGNLVSNGDFSQESAELITNGDFATDTAWVKGIGWSISGGTANCDGTQTSQSNFFQVGVVPINTFYKVTFTATISAGGVILAIGGSNAQPTVTASGTYTFTSRANSGDANLYLSGNADFIGSIDNVSAKEVGQDWSFVNADISIGNNGLEIISQGGNRPQANQIISGLTVGNKYKLSAIAKRGTCVSSVEIEISGIGSTVTTNQNNTTEFANIFYEFTATSTSHTIQAKIDDGASTIGETAFFKSVSVIEITEDTNLPRIDYTGGEGHWLFEPQSTNLIPYSEDFSQSAWVKSGSSFESGYLSPSGETNASKFTAINTDPYLLYAISGVTNLTYSASLYIKGTTSTIGETARLWIIRDNVVFHSEDFTITDIWQRISTTKTFTSTPTSFVSLRVDLPNTNVSIGDEAYIWGAQLEAQSFATSIIPTEGAIKTRLQDAAFGAGSSDLINSTEGVLYAEVSRFANDILNTAISINQSGNFSNSVSIKFRSTENLIFGLIYSGGNISTIMQHTLPDDTQFNKIAISYAENNFALWVNGIKVLTDTSGNAPIGLNNLSFNLGAENFYGKTKCLAVFKEALTDAELTCLTTI